MVFAHYDWSISRHSINNKPWLLVLIRRDILNLLDRLLLWKCELRHMLNWLTHLIVFLFPVEHFMNLLLGIAFCRHVLRMNRLLNVILGVFWLLNDLRGLNRCLVLLIGQYMPLFINYMTLGSLTMALI